MLHGKKVVVVLPAYRAAKTLERTYRDIPRDVVDEGELVLDEGGLALFRADERQPDPRTRDTPEPVEDVFRRDRPWHGRRRGLA